MDDVNGQRMEKSNASEKAVTAILDTSDKLISAAMANADAAEAMADGIKKEMTETVSNMTKVLDTHCMNLRKDMDKFSQIMSVKMRRLAQLTSDFIGHCERASSEMAVHTDGLENIGGQVSQAEQPREDLRLVPRA
jgi:uncharacterized glyoxalase superfamily protein PhnB